MASFPWETTNDACPSCGGRGLQSFYELADVPAQSCLILDDPEAATAFPRADIRLAFCDACGFVTNTLFDPAAVEYSTRYEETQGFSPTFSAFARSLAERLMERHSLRDRTVMEIGCGKGEFLSLLCELGAARGIGVDPAYVPSRNTSPAADRVEVLDAFFEESHGALAPDFICCRHTLEHIHDVHGFLTTLRRAIGDRDVEVFFEVPDAGRVIGEAAFLDIYNEHCSYFSQRSLINAFVRAGFEVTDSWLEYGDQYLMLTARPGREIGVVEPDAGMRQAVRAFEGRCRPVIEMWRERIAACRARNEHAVVWGSGSKCVAFLSTVGVVDEIQYVIDINPHRQGRYMPGVPQRIEAPERVRELAPQNVIVMNPIYLDEIGRQLAGLGSSPQLMAA